LTVGLIAVPATAFADGLPQLDFANELTTYQVVWGIVIFFLLYVLTSRTALPRVEAVLLERASQIAGDLENAQNAKSRADLGIQAAVDAIGKARVEAQAAITAALELSKREVSAQTAALNDRLECQLREAEKQIRTARNAAMIALPSVAADTAEDLILRLTGWTPDTQRLNDAISAAISARVAS
jgi:F-type H+-transporting ATPase subunit b